MKSIKEQAIEILQRCETIVLASVNKDGYPRPVPMSKIHTEGLNEIWMATGKNSLKTKDFIRSSQAGICFSEAENSVAMTGKIEIVTDKAVKEKLWQEWFIVHFPGGVADKNYILLKFTGCHATFWVDGKFCHRNI